MPIDNNRDKTAMMQNINIDELSINTIRFLSVDAVEKAKSGHPGTPMGAATLAYVLWDRFLKHNPKDPQWINRDRFVLSAGHASMLLYSLLFLTGYDLSLEEIKNFRQWGSKTPGHPEYGLTPGVETTTGPLGQGFANGVGMAIGERILSQRFNRPGFEIFDHYTYALVSDGDMEEGVSSEAGSLAGALKLGKLIYLYDSNQIQQDGPTSDSLLENVALRFQAYDWNVIGPIDGMDAEAVNSALITAQSQKLRPNLIICRTIIGYGSPNKAGTEKAHGEALGEDEVRLTKENLQWPFKEPFAVPEDALTHFRKATDRGKGLQEGWQTRFDEYRQKYPELAQQIESEMRGELPTGWDQELEQQLNNFTKSTATRDASGVLLNHIASKVPSLWGGAADLAVSTRTLLKGSGDFSAGNYAGRNLRFGLREHAMGAITNGIALHGGIIPFAASFLIFSDYMRPPMRLASLMKLRIIYIFSHDSIALGEDGPTHQPVEQLMGLRMIPNLMLIRPADATETLEAWKIAMFRREGPTALILTRQPVPVLDRSALSPASGVRKGGYILWESGTNPQVILMGTGSEVHTALEAGRILKGKNIAARVVSLPCWSLFDSQSESYRNGVLPPEISARISIEAGTPLGWEHYVGLKGHAIGISRFGASAPGNVIYEKLGLTAQQVVDEALRLL
jgi:transketolase